MERRKRVMAGSNKISGKSQNATDAAQPVKSDKTAANTKEMPNSSIADETADSGASIAEAVTRIKDATLKYSIEPDNSLTLAIKEQVLAGDSPLVIQDSVMERPGIEAYQHKFDHRNDAYPDDYAGAAVSNSSGPVATDNDGDDVEVVTL